MSGAVRSGAGRLLLSGDDAPFVWVVVMYLSFGEGRAEQVQPGSRERFDDAGGVAKPD
jgi:hypothetical protein